MPQMLLSATNLVNSRPQAILFYICTTDKVVCKLGKLNTLERVALLENPLSTIIRTNPDELDRGVFKLVDSYTNRAIARQSEPRVEYRGLASKEQLLDLVADLEEQIKPFCKKKLNCRDNYE